MSPVNLQVCVESKTNFLDFKCFWPEKPFFLLLLLLVLQPCSKIDYIHFFYIYTKFFIMT